MGIRYYAYPVRQDDIEFARQSPRDFIASDPLSDAWGPMERQPRMLYLDKAWRQLHELFDRVCPAASPLVDGDVTHCSFGWIPHLGVLDPSEVVLIAAALSTVSESDVLTEPLPAHIGDGLLRDISEELDYVVQYLEEAKKFTAALAEDSLGLVYMIG